ncbi:MAG TPA: CoB--CoM heterodisulfide reductase iron-sulfur subunit B family protein [Candidatus Kryptonia bacterium]
MKMGLYPGCSLEGSAREYAESLRAIAPLLNLDLREVEGWNCCGASSAHIIDHAVSLALPARILAQAVKQEMDEVLVPCAACFNRLASAKHELAADPGVREEVSAMIGMNLDDNTEIRNILEVLDKVLTPDIIKSIPNTFPHKVACYYGCLLVRPPDVVRSDKPEDPVVMDGLMKKIGATTIDWGMKTECCGASLSIPRTDIVGILCGRILEDAFIRGAEAIVVACPMCHSNLDMRRSEVERTTGKKFSLPVIYITQAIGLAFGLSPDVLGIQRHFVRMGLEARNKVPQKPLAKEAGS